MPHPTPDPVRAGQESVWDYPRPPRVDAADRRVVVRLGGAVLVDTTDVVRVRETSHPPVYYLPITAFVEGALTAGEGSSFCEFKGAARYLDVRGGDEVRLRAAWNYPHPSPGFEALGGRVALYPAAMDSCTLDGEVVRAQPGGFYGGWITADIAGPFKGVPGSRGW
jgi:uncharacterized protein (DUF427 family)